MQQQKVEREVIFSELAIGFAGSRVCKPRCKFKSSVLEPFFHVVLKGALCAHAAQLNYHIKASVKLVTFNREKQIIPWQGVYFLPTLFKLQ